jgi:ABC-type lipoprotein release transport system permease subunit
MLGALFSDGRYALRALLARPAITAVAVATLASYVAARRASAVDPAESLAAE